MQKQLCERKERGSLRSKTPFFHISFLSHNCFCIYLLTIGMNGVTPFSLTFHNQLCEMAPFHLRGIEVDFACNHSARWETFWAMARWLEILCRITHFVGKPKWIKKILPSESLRLNWKIIQLTCNLLAITQLEGRHFEPCPDGYGCLSVLPTL
jgi:hypothetical protein